MRCKACNKDMKSNSGDEYWRDIKVDRKKHRVLEDLCKKCRSEIYSPDDDWRKDIGIVHEKTSIE